MKKLNVNLAEMNNYKKFKRKMKMILTIKVQNYFLLMIRSHKKTQKYYKKIKKFKKKNQLKNHKLMKLNHI